MYEPFLFCQMMNQLQLYEGDLITVEYKTLPNATYAKFKPMSTDFYHISNPRAMLEVELRKFACLSKADVIAVQVGNTSPFRDSWKLIYFLRTFTYQKLVSFAVQ